LNGIAQSSCHTSKRSKRPSLAVWGSTRILDSGSQTWNLLWPRAVHRNWMEFWKTFWLFWTRSRT